MFDEAIADFLKAGEFFGGRAVSGRLGHAYGVSGKVKEATKILDDLMQEPAAPPPPRNPFIPPPQDPALDIALIYLELRDKEHSLDWLEKATDARTAEIIHAKCEPIYDILQEEPRFKSLKRKGRIGVAHQAVRKNLPSCEVVKPPWPP
jgi:hypothetical protein